MRKSGGGAATAGGMDFQHRVAAWVAVHILAEKDATPPWDLPTGTTLEWLWGEPKQQVDDLLVGTSANGLIFCQIKTSPNIEKAADSPLASALDQFVRQFVDCGARSTGTQPWDRPLSGERDRLVLTTSANTHKPVRLHLPSVLGRLRGLPEGQPLDKAAVNQDELRALTVVQAHVKRSWHKALETDPSENDLRQLLALIHVQDLDVDEEGTGEREARTLLRTAVLSDPDDAETAWACLLSLCATLAKKQSGADRLALQHALLNAGIQLKGPRSYQNDIEKLRRYSDRTCDALAHHAQIKVGYTPIKIRRACTEPLRQAAEEGSIMVVGEPGAGKSGVLYELVKAFREERRDYVFIAVDRLAASSLAELRAELGLDHELVQVLENWPGLQPAFLVIDALDAARGDPAGAMIHELFRILAQKGGRWQVVASIRKFDLRYGVEIKELFAGILVEQCQDTEFKGVRHLKVPSLSDGELAQISLQCSELHALVLSAPIELHDLLRVPFNLWLMTELLNSGAAENELTPIKTPLELLNLYWLHRIIRKDGQRDAREWVLRNTCQNMVDARVLRVDRSAVAEPKSSTHLNDLLRNQVLVEWQSSPNALPDQYILAFSHHVLFDYAVARLLLRGTPGDVVRWLDDDPDLAVVVRPSLLFHFRHLWSVDSNRRQFWDFVFEVMRAKRFPEIGKLIGPSVAAELARSLPDLAPLCSALDDSSCQTHPVAVQSLKHLVEALLAGVSGADPLVGAGERPWCRLLDHVTSFLQLPVAYSVQSLLSAICEHPEQCTPDQMSATGRTARRLLDFASSRSPRDRWLVIHALTCVCRTFPSDPAASAGLIRRCLEPFHFSQHRSEEMPWLAREVKRLLGFDPALVEEIYSVAFNNPETSTEPTQMGSGRILSLISTRQQDYKGALYQLAKVFPAFLDLAPEDAIRALIAVVEAHVAQRHSTTSGTEQEETFDFDGRQARLRTDYSAIWDGSDTYRHHEPLKMLDAFQQYLERLAEQPETVDGMRELLQLLTSENRLAALWRRVLMAATSHPATLGREILPIAWAIPVLTSYDTKVPAGEYLRAIFPNLDHPHRERIERAILSIPEIVPVERRQLQEHIRNRLLGCLTGADLATPAAKRLLEQLQAKDAVPPNEPPFRFESWSGPYGEEEYLRDEGVPVEADANRKIRELEQPVKEFADQQLNSTPTSEERSIVLPVMRTLHEALGRAEADGIHPKQSEHAWGCLAAACACIAKTEGLTAEEQPGSFVKAVLLEASRHPEPAYDPEYDAQFDENPSWGSPSPRIEAAEGLVALVRHPSCATSEMLEAIERLSQDPVPAVRYQIACRIDDLRRSVPELMWQVIEMMSREDSSRGVLQGLLGVPLQGLARLMPDRVTDLTRIIFDRVREGPGAKRVREFCVGIFTGLYIWRDHFQCSEVIQEIAKNPVSYSDEASHLLPHLQEPLTLGYSHPPDSTKDAVWRRALDLLHLILHSARTALDEITGRHSGTPFDEWPPEEQKNARSLAQLIDQVGSEVYFSSGAQDGSEQRRLEEDLHLQRKRKMWFDEMRPILDELADSGLPSVTHHLLQALEFLIPLDAAGVFQYIGRVVRAGRQGGYQYESLAADLVVKLVERYLAEYRSILREDAESRHTLIEILDIFVQAGWPSARRLTYRLEEIFR